MKWLAQQPRTGGKALSAPSVKQGFARSSHTYSDQWDSTRAVDEGMSRVTWVYRSVDAIASNQAKIPLVFRRDDAQTGEEVITHPTYPVLNSKSNLGENSFVFRYRLSAQLLLSKKGVFIEIVRSRGTGEVLALVILPPEFTTPKPDRKLFVKNFEVAVPGERPVTLQPENVLWIRKPHPTDPYGALTPLEAAGLAVETDYLARVYNWNFMLNDGRPGGLIVVKGEMTDEDKDELRSRFSGNVNTAGRISVIATDEGADFVDTAITPRDAQYVDTRRLTKEEVLMAFGVPESVLANAAGRTFDNAEQERLIFWMETMSAHLELLARSFDVLDEDPLTFAAFDTSTIDVIQRAEAKRREFLLKEWMEGVITQDEYRRETRRPLLPSRGNRLYMPKSRGAVATTDGEEIPDSAANPSRAPGRPPNAGAEIAEVDEDEPQERTPPLLRAASARAVGSAHPVLAPQEVTLRVVAGEKELAQPDPVVKVKVGPYTVLEEDLVRFKQSASDDFDRWEDVFERMMVRFFARQKRVVVEKITGSKSRKTFRSSVDVKASVAQVFDIEVWNSQLAEDAGALIAEVMDEFGANLARHLSVPWNADDARLADALERETKRVALVNETTQAALLEARSASDTPELFAERARLIFEEAVETRAQRTATTQVVAAANVGKLVAMLQFAATQDGGPVHKTWLTVGDGRVRDAHAAREGQTVEVGESFDGGIAYPGDPSASAGETVGCRCTMTTDSGGALVL